MTDLPDRLRIRAFGQSLDLDAPKVAALREDSLWRIGMHYSPAMTARSLDPQGLAIDIGAGFGSFALPFALAFPGWTVLAFEPDPDCFAALTANAARLGAQNLIAVNVAVGPVKQMPPDPEAVTATLAAILTRDAQPDTLPAQLPRVAFARQVSNPGYLQPGPAPDDSFQTLRLPSLSAEFLAALAPQLIKLTAPQMERHILNALRDTALDHVIGEGWGEVEATTAYGDRPGRREIWLPKAGPGLLALRHAPLPGQRRIGLDVVVPLHNQRKFVLECIETLLARPCPEMRVIVVDDGSTDTSAKLVRRDYLGHPRVKLVSKPNGGCASARNYGRMLSDSSHIAFVDADDLPNPQLFPGLLELALQTGAEIVQAGFHKFDGDEITPSDESHAPILHEAYRHRLGQRSCCLLPAAWLLQGQPSIWRRVYRRDFLDTRRIWFLEHIRAFDDQLFQLLTLQSVVNVPVLDGVSYGYRQHPDQDIKQKDERHFYSLEMFRLALRRGLAEGWPDFGPVLTSFIHTVNWATEGLRPNLVATFVKGAAELWVIAAKIFGPETLPTKVTFRHPAIEPQIAALTERLASLPQSAAYVFLDSPNWQVPMVRTPWG